MRVQSIRALESSSWRTVDVETKYIHSLTQPHFQPGAQQQNEIRNARQQNTKIPEIVRPSSRKSSRVDGRRGREVGGLDHLQVTSLKIGVKTSQIVLSPAWCSKLRLTTGVTWLFAMNFVGLDLAFADQVASVTTL
ncbi:hypothetical protein TNCV_3826941 [Trichonephila clavipes]|nr:hypothetical protein TNCV_3826941 [Trichonephila clavipes]